MRSTSLSGSSLLALLMLHAAPAVAQEATDLGTIKEMLVYGFEQAKLMDIDYCQAMPVATMRWKPAPEVRDFAQQMAHIVQGNNAIIGRGALGATPPSMGDSAVYLNDPAALEEMITASYDWLLDGLKAMPTERLDESVNVFGNDMKMWRAYMFALTHSYWTRGQTVPYLRANGVEPPSFRPF